MTSVHPDNRGLPLEASKEEVIAYLTQIAIEEKKLSDDFEKRGLGKARNIFSLKPGAETLPVMGASVPTVYTVYICSQMFEFDCFFPDGNFSILLR